jgi:hypothetical protein
VRAWIFVMAGLLVIVACAEATAVPAWLACGRRFVVPAELVGAAVGVWLPLGPLRRANRPPEQVHPLQVEPTGLRLPGSIRSSRVAWIPFEELQGMELRGRVGRRIVLIHTAPASFIFPASSFVDGADGERFVNATRKAIEAHDPRLLARMEPAPGAVR